MQWKQKACLLRDNISSHKQDEGRRSNAVTHTREVCESRAARLGFDSNVRLWSGFETFCLLVNTQPIGQIGSKWFTGELRWWSGAFQCIVPLGTDLLCSLYLATKPVHNKECFE